MSFRITWNVPEIIQQIHKMRSEVCSPYNDGFTAWEVKKDLYQIKWIVDDAMKSCPTFADEEAWLKEQDQKRMWEAIKGKK